MCDCPKNDESANPPTNPLREQVIEALNGIRPMLQQDGGDIEFVDLTDDGVVSVRFHGACVGCPARSQTLSQGVEAQLKQQIPAIQAVQAVG